MKLGIVGTGKVAKAHAKAIKQISPNLIGGAWNRTAATAQEFCKEHGGQAFDTLEQLVGADDIDAIVITSSTPTHFAIATAALEAGKHVLLEKPVCENASQILELSETARRTGKICMPSHNYLYSQDVRRLHHHVQAGHLGKVQNFWVLFNNAHPPHDGMTGTYMMLCTMGRPISVSAVGSNSHFEDPSAIDQMSIIASFEDGRVANLWGGFAAEDLAREPWSYVVKVMGTKGTGMATWDKIKYGEQTEPLWDDAGYWDRFFVEECLAKSAAPLSTLEDAHDAATIFAASVSSLQERRQVEINYDAG